MQVMNGMNFFRGKYRRMEEYLQKKEQEGREQQRHEDVHDGSFYIAISSLQRHVGYMLGNPLTVQ